MKIGLKAPMKHKKLKSSPRSSRWVPLPSWLSFDEPGATATGYSDSLSPSRAPSSSFESFDLGESSKITSKVKASASHSDEDLSLPFEADKLFPTPDKGGDELSLFSQFK